MSEISVDLCIIYVCKDMLISQWFVNGFRWSWCRSDGILTADGIVRKRGTFLPFSLCCRKRWLYMGNKLKVESTARIGAILSAADSEWLSNEHKNVEFGWEMSEIWVDLCIIYVWKDVMISQWFVNGFRWSWCRSEGIRTADAIVPKRGTVLPLYLCCRKKCLYMGNKVKVESTARIGVILSAAHFEWV